MDSAIVKPTSSPILIYRYVLEVFPLVKAELEKWKRAAQQAPDANLAAQAIASIEQKGFHCLGGSIFGLYPGVRMKQVIEFVVAFQTISDYLDNLVDQLDIQDELAFYQLHLAMLEALEPEVKRSDYYLYYPYSEDGGYLDSLVLTCQKNLSQLPAYKIIQVELYWLVSMYNSLQVNKHLAAEEREQRVVAWSDEYLFAYPELSNWEFAAASGSTLGIFSLYAAGFDSKLNSDKAHRLSQAYFPWITGLHILLDYFIDLEEDAVRGELNFVQYYTSEPERQERLQLFLTNSLTRANELEYAGFHRVVVNGLMAMYLSDVKSRSRNIRSTTDHLLAESGNMVKILYQLCALLRRYKLI